MSNNFVFYHCYPGIEWVLTHKHCMSSGQLGDPGSHNYLVVVASLGHSGTEVGHFRVEQGHDGDGRQSGRLWTTLGFNIPNGVKQRQSSSLLSIVCRIF